MLNRSYISYRNRMNKNGDDSPNLRRALTALQTHSFGSSGYFIERVHAIIMQMILMPGN